MAFDPHSVLGFSTVQTGSGVIGSISGNTIIVATGDGGKFSIGQNIIVWPSGSQPLLHNATYTTGNSEIMRISDITTDTLSVSRSQEGTTALSNITTGYQVANTASPKTFTDIESVITTLQANNTGTNTGDQTNITGSAALNILKTGDTSTGSQIMPSVVISDPAGGVYSTATSGQLRVFGGINNDGGGIVLTGSTNGYPNRGLMRIGLNTIGQWNSIGFLLGGSVDATHSLTLSAASTGIASYNTADQFVNYERVRQYWSGNAYNFKGELGGTGSARGINFGTANRNSLIQLSDSASATVGYVSIGSGGSGGGSTSVSSNGTWSNSSGIAYNFSMLPNFVQSGTAGYTALLVNPTETAIGSGVKLLIDAQVGGVSKFNVSNTGIITGIGSAITAIPESAVTNLTTDLAAKISFDSTSSTRLAATSGTNTGDQVLTGLVTKGSLVFNVVDYGLIGDGTTDNQTAMVALISTVQTAGGGIIFFPKGIYTWSGSPQITGSNITIEGTGKGSVILLGSATLNANGTVMGLWLNGATNITIRNLTVDGNFANIAKNGTYTTSSNLWNPIIAKYGSTSVKNYIYAGSGVDSSTYLTYRQPIRITDSSNIIVENCLIQNSIGAGILIDATSVDNSQEIMIRNNRVKLTWDNGIYFHKGVRFGSAIGNHVSDTQYAGVTAIFCNDILTDGNVIHDNGPSQSDSAGIEYCGVIKGLISNNTVYNSLFEGILLKNTSETAITGGFANNFVKNYDIQISGNTVSDIHDPRQSVGGGIGLGINIMSADRTHIIGNNVLRADYGISVGIQADDTVIEANHVNYSYSWGIQVGNQPDVTNTTIINNVIENGADNGIEVYAPATIKNNIIRNNAHQGIDLAAPPTGIPYKTDYIENNTFADNGYNGMQAGAGAGNLAIIKNNEFYNSDYYTYVDGVSNSSTTFTSSTGNFSASDVGAVVVITGVGDSTGNASLTATISAVASSTSVTLSTAASFTRNSINFTVFRQKNVYFDGSMSGTNFTSLTANFTSVDVGKSISLYSSDGPTPSLIGNYSVSSVTSGTVAVLSAAPTGNSNILFVIKRNYGRQGRAVYIASSSDIHYTGNRSWSMSTENYNKGSLTNNSFVSNNFDFGSSTSNQDPVNNPITPIANSQNYTAYPGQKDSVFQMNAASAAQNVYLPSTSTVAKGTVYTVKKIDTSVNTVTVNGSNSQTIDGVASYVLAASKQVATFISDGSNWQLTSEGGTNSAPTTGTGSRVFSISPSLTTPRADFITDTNGGKEIELVATASTANWIKLTNTVTGGGATISVNGTAANENLFLAALGIGTVQIGGSQVTTASNAQTLTNKRITNRIQSLTSSATITPAGDTNDLVVATAQAALFTLVNPTGTPTDGQKLIVRIKATGAFAITYGTLYLSSGNATLPTSTVSGKTITLSVMYDATAVKWVLITVDGIGY
jgi:hypothetical protein